MTAQSPSAFFLSATLHAGVAAVLLLLAYGLRTERPPQTKVFELVAGAGDNYMATEAPALGNSAIKVDVPNPPKATPTPPAPAPEQTPVAPAPVPQPSPVTPAATPKAAPKQPTIAKTILRKVLNAEKKAKAEVDKERKEEERRQEALDKQRAKDEAKNPKVARVNVEGIPTGVEGGSTANRIGGAGGNALTAEEGNVADRYLSMALQQLKDELDQMPGLEDGLRAEADFRIMPDGRLARGQIVKSSGNETFDRAVLRAIAAVRLPPRPKGVEEMQNSVPFTTHAKQ